MRYYILLLAGLGCGDADKSDTGGGDADTDTDTDTDTDPAGCTPLTAGAWIADGTCIGMEMEATLTLDAAGCTFTFSEWNMEMSNLPSGGTVTGSDVTVTGDDWMDCTGTTDGTSIEGTCADGCAFEMSFAG